MHSQRSSQSYQKINFSGVDTSSADYQKNIKNLLDICHGPLPAGSRYLFTRVLSSEELLLALLRLNKTIKYLNNDPAFSIQVLKTLIKFSRVPWDIVYSLVTSVLSLTSSPKEDLTLLLWSIKDLGGFPIRIASILIKEEPEFIEKYIFHVYKNQTDLNFDQWKEESNKWLVTWSCQSSEVFTFLSGILNQFLICSRYKQVLLKIIKDYVENVQSACERNNRDFVLLYPLEYQSLVSILTLEPEYNPCKPDGIKRLRDLENHSPSMALLIYSHFSEWLDPVI